MIDSSLFKKWQFWVTMLVSIIIVLGVTYFLSPTEFPKAFSNALVAWGTLMLAIATFMLIVCTIQIDQEKKKEELVKEKRILKEKWLDEIKDWSCEIANVSFGHEFEYKNLPDDDVIIRAIDNLGKKIMRYQATDAKSPYILKIAEQFEGNLHSLISDILSCRNNISVQIDPLLKDTQNQVLIESLNKAELELRDKALLILESAAEINIGLIAL